MPDKRREKELLCIACVCFLSYCKTLKRSKQKVWQRKKKAAPGCFVLLPILPPFLKTEGFKGTCSLFLLLVYHLNTVSFVFSARLPLPPVRRVCVTPETADSLISLEIWVKDIWACNAQISLDMPGRKLLVTRTYNLPCELERFGWAKEENNVNLYVIFFSARNREGSYLRRTLLYLKISLALRISGENAQEEEEEVSLQGDWVMKYRNI